MIRTKDLLLFLLTIFFLGIAISVTLSVHHVRGTGNQNQDVSFGTSEITEFAADEPFKQSDRASEIERLRLKLAEHTSIISAVPSVETPESPKEANAEDAVLGRCDVTDDSLFFARTWPLQDVSVLTEEGARVIVHLTTEEVSQVVTGTTSSTTVAITQQEIKTPLLQLPLLPTSDGDSHCLPSEIIGVTLEGELIFNGDVILYGAYGSNDLIGYARDGFPIYGPFDGEVDVCGGYESATGYRYAALSSPAKFINCFKAQPQSFLSQ